MVSPDALKTNPLFPGESSQIETTPDTPITAGAVAVPDPAAAPLLLRPPRSSAADGLALMQMIDALYKSIQTGKSADVRPTPLNRLSFTS